ncbi:MAG TPA: GyrI-like domain-containing protein, partial [Polyangia bacterium]|nr:GyrI-like domain-containing protein [Polyangia bacterium]
MNVTIEDRPELRVATVHHVGPYQRISEAFQRLGDIAGPAGLLQFPEAAMLAIYHDDPETTPAAELQSDAGIVVPSGVPLPKGLGEQRLTPGRYARTTHVGPYTELGDVWSRLM